MGGTSGGRGVPSMSRAARPVARPRPSVSMPRPSVRPSRPSVRPPAPGRPSTRPSIRPSTRPATRPGSGLRPGMASRPGVRPGPTTRPSGDQLQKFLDLPRPSTGRPTGRPSTLPAIGAGAAVIGGGAAAEFLKSRRPGDSMPDRGRPIHQIQRPGQRPAIQPVRPGERPERPDHRPGVLPERPGQRPGVLPERPGVRPGDRPLRPGVRPGIPDRARTIHRIINRADWLEARRDRSKNIRHRWQQHHPRWDFWKSHPHWAHWRWHRPYRWATWTVVTAWFPWGWSQPVYYSYGDNVYYQGDTVYYGDEALCSAEEYAAQAQEIATSAPEPDEQAEWMPLGVFALTQTEEDAPEPTLFLQLAVNKQGIIAGTFFDSASNVTKPVEGMVDKQTQRSAWTVVDEKWPIMEAGIANLTQDTAPVLVHFEDGQTQSWLLVRLEEPKEAQQEVQAAQPAQKP